MANFNAATRGWKMKLSFFDRIRIFFGAEIHVNVCSKQLESVSWYIVGDDEPRFEYSRRTY